MHIEYQNGLYLFWYNHTRIRLCAVAVVVKEPFQLWQSFYLNHHSMIIDPCPLYIPLTAVKLEHLKPSHITHEEAIPRIVKYTVLNTTVGGSGQGTTFSGTFNTSQGTT